ALPFTGYDVASMYLGLMNYSNQFVRGMFYMRAKEFAGYFQDKWKIAPKLTLSLGLRYEYWPPYTETNRLMTSFDANTHSIILDKDLNSLYRLGATRPDIVNQLTKIGVKFETAQQAGLPGNLINASHRDWGPRLGFAYRLGNKPGSPVLRGGYRIS